MNMYRYSTIWLAKALPEDGELITMEVDPHTAKVRTVKILGATLPTIHVLISSPY
jgi:predicted O-methyltransferase YrrM